MSGGGSDNHGNGRQPKDMKGLLKFCMENTRAEDAPASGTFRELSPERKEWLSKALDGMTCDPVKEMQEHMKTVGVYLGSEQPTDEARDNALTSLDMLFDWCECIDMARDFLNIGGFSILHEMMTHSESEFRGHSFKLIGVLVQNNPVCQQAVLDYDLLPTMLKVLETESNPTVQYQAVQAISCLVRDCSLEAVEQQFVAHNGFGVLKKVLQTQGPFKRVVKVAFFLLVMCEKNPKHKDTVCELGIPEILLQELKNEHEQTHEQVMAALLCLAKEHPPTQQALAKPELQTKQFLQQRIQFLQGREENNEEMQYAQELLRIISPDDGLSAPHLCCVKDAAYV